MNINNPIPRSVAKVISLLCGLLFFAFCFTYLYCLEGDLLAQAQYVFAKGVTSYNHFWAACIIPAVLLLVQYGVNRVVKMSGRWYAVSYFPSFLLLAIMTSVNCSTIYDFTFSGWYWGCPLLLVLFVAVVWIIHHFQTSSMVDGNYSIFRYLWPNFLLMTAMILFCGACNSAGDSYLLELRAERLIMEGKYGEAAGVGRKSLVVNPRLNCLRYYALARQGLLADHLFDYPVNGDTNVLIDLTDTNTMVHRFNSKDICAYLGAIPNRFVSSPEQYLEFVMKMDSLPDARAVADYYLCSLLMKKDLDTFRRKLPHSYPCRRNEDIAALPRIYKEALIIDRLYKGRERLFPDSVVRADYEEYVKIGGELTDSTERANVLRRKYGNTLWWHLGIGCRQ